VMTDTNNKKKHHCRTNTFIALLRIKIPHSFQKHQETTIKTEIFIRKPSP